MMKGYVQVYTGCGKGKTTAALGLALRAVGAGLHVYIGQFIKGSDTSELKAIKTKLPEISIDQYGAGRFIQKKPTDKDIEMAKEGLWKLNYAVTCGKYDVVIADEANCAVTAKLIDVEELLEIIRNKPESVELIITGRNADQRLIDVADLVTEMIPIKHYFNDDVPARKGIED